MKSFFFAVLVVFLAVAAIDQILTSHVMVVNGLDMLGCATNRCVSINDTTYLIK